MASNASSLIAALRRLDLLLEGALAAAKVVSDPESAPAFRGLYIAPEEASKLVGREPGSPTFGAFRSDSGSLLASPAEIPELGRLATAFGLSAFDVDIIVVALAPEFDLRYERLYAYLQDDVTRRRPSVDLTLNLLSSSAEKKLAGRANFALEAPLIRHGLVHLVADPNHVQPPLLAHYIKLDDQVVRLLLGEQGLDRRLDGCCWLLTPDAETTSLEQLPLERETEVALRALAGRARDAHQPLRLHFCGRRGAGKLRAAVALAKVDRLQPARG